jgi:hypothetical protein
MSETPVHRRSIEIDSYLEGDTLRVVGQLRDERPWSDTRRIMHDMELRLRVRLADMTIVEADAQMHTYPHDECPFILPKFAQLEGLSITRGFTRALREAFAGVSGCQHLHELARVAGPAVFQATAAMRSARRNPDDPATFDDPERTLRAMNSTCHIWAPDGVGPQKLELGWRAGQRDYPAPSVERLRARD